jgi:hypothetical protein
MANHKLGSAQRFVYSRLRNGYRIREVFDLNVMKVRNHLIFGGDDVVSIRTHVVDSLFKKNLIQIECQSVDKKGCLVTTYKISK